MAYTVNNRKDNNRNTNANNNTNSQPNNESGAKSFNELRREREANANTDNRQSNGNNIPSNNRGYNTNANADNRQSNGNNIPSNNSGYNTNANTDNRQSSGNNATGNQQENTAELPVDFAYDGQIAHTMNQKTCLAFYDRLNVSDTTLYAQIHAEADEDKKGKRTYSNIRVQLQEFSNKPTVMLYFNIAPEEAQYYLSVIERGTETFQDFAEKRYDTDKKGVSLVRKFGIWRSPKDSKGEVMRSPWHIKIEEGTGHTKAFSNGATAYTDYKAVRSVSRSMTDKELYCLLKRVDKFINLYEQSLCPERILNGRKERFKRTAALKKEQSE